MGIVIQLNIKYVNVKLPEELSNEVDKLIGHHGFVSRAAIVKEALRKMLPDYQKGEG